MVGLRIGRRRRFQAPLTEEDRNNVEERRQPQSSITKPAVQPENKTSDPEE